MKVLLDTNIVLWSVAESYKFNARAREILFSPSSDLHLSSATAWEIAIKFALGTLKLPLDPAEFIPDIIRRLRLRTVQITFAHAIEAGRLPPHHRDPFDRMLIAQAKVEGFVLLTADAMLQKYDVAQIHCAR